ncbi:hypothetical protein [Butyrivibrio sp. WCD3002]|uniref:hypothetical protein n=1 Tax=Butyrivibrio sp. WCD3002 TaxID=1280676 RepID=UPI000406B8AE|nr:hypothetical protein [Butyrivibrio sp. WCD3002]
MKKVIATVLTMGLALSMAACGSKTAEGTQDAATEAVSEVAEEVSEAAQEVAEDASDAAEEAVEEVVEEDSEGEEATEEAAGDVMTHEDYVAAELDSEVTVETYVQAKQGWWENEGVGNATFYTQAEDGAYFIYNMPCSEEEYEQLTPGTKIKVTGYKSEWSGEVEITDAKFEIEDGNFVAEALDVTDLLADDAIIDHQNEFVAFKGMTVEASKDADGNDVAFLYNYDGSGSQGDDLYFNVSANGTTYTFTVESYLCGQDSDVYKAVEGLNVGDTVDMEGFLYWYEGVNPHITSVSVQ